MSSIQKSLVKIASAIAPGYVTNFAYKQLSNPQLKKLRDRELKVLSESEEEDIQFGGFNIKQYRWRGAGQRVLLIHGWEGQAGNFTDIINELRQRGNDIIAFDAPSHGFSSRGDASLIEFTDLVGVMLRKFKPRRLISHSFGGVATTYALSKNPEIEIDRYLLLTVPDKFSDRIDTVADAVGISDKVVKMLKAKLEQEYKQKISDLNVSDFVKVASVKSALVLHDENDRVLPIESSKGVVSNWPQATLEPVSGTGHFRILREDAIIQRVADWING